MTRPFSASSLRGLAWGLLLVAGGTAQAAEPETAGVVRISKPASHTVRAQSEGIQLTGCKECEGAWSGSKHGGYYSSGSEGYPYGGYGGGHGGWGKGGSCDSCYGGGSDPVLEYFKCKFGFLIPTGCGGAGCPPIGKYARVYPNDPSYFDGRDGQAWGAHGYGVPVAVPLAPVVSHQYNYSWGTPASRLTPVSRIAPY